ncbi:cell envelope integrity protein TolA [Cellvibrio japonicus]|uniref:Putative biopolymer transport protein TolA n=1 Tax=Cellvibrio japonicus (strain Ueda107) TaxID=498211 RepID=B3PB62_CELJU|nr:cell envelope integrity protein TolA [Cellvibrio japonicus]ACE84194.1 putative biopolymer transport protein TolA [Cellvibrio japonicus Ueda107]QEI11652.1 cell envelope integrity protein TolA [Cellvibrio japonicus]QEI15226.1 cell envelope integrity protein TolA [Cellvibrio japonicus]QEI18806.1 cell envelope integrity protein TolA [Cellvibrio japonicus]
MVLDQRFTLPVLFSVVLHALILVLFFGDWGFFRTKEPEPVPPRYVTATLVDLQPKAKAAPPQPKEQNLDAKRFEDLKNLKNREEQKRKEAEAQVQRQKEQAAKEAAAKEEALKQQKLKDQQAKVAREKAEAERKKKLEEERRKAEAEQKRKREQEAQEEIRRQQAAYQKEEKHLSDTADDASVISYNELLARRVGENFSPPPSARLGMVSVFIIDMLPNGQVVGVALSRSSGNDAFDRAAEQAIRRVDRFVEIKDIPIDVFERNFRRFTFTFDPKDLRL